MINDFSIENFRGIKNLNFSDLKRINLFVGYNNSGKTTILESLFLLIGITKPLLVPRLNIFRDLIYVNDSIWRSYFYDMNTNNKIKLSMNYLGKEKKDNQKRNLSIEPRYFNEKISLNQNDKINLSSSSDEISTQNENINGLVCCSTLKDIDKNSTDFKSEVYAENGELFTFDHKKTDYQEKLMGVYLGSHTIYKDIKVKLDIIQVKKEKPKIINVLQEIEPKLVDIIIGDKDIIYCDIGLSRLIPLNLLGDGIIKILSIVLAISETENGVILIDEIENGLHHKSQETLWKIIFKSSEEFNVQIFATTHSLDNVNALVRLSYQNNDIDFSNFSLIRIENEDGIINTIPFTHEQLSEALSMNLEIR